MGWLPKKHFVWREPKAFLELSEAFDRSRRKWWHAPLWILVAMAGIMIPWAMAKITPGKHPPEWWQALLVAFGGAVFFVYAFPWMIRLCPSEVRLYEKALMRGRGNVHLALKYADMTSFAWCPLDGYGTLIIKHGEEGVWETVFGVPLEVDQKAVTRFLEERGVREEGGRKAGEPLMDTDGH